MSTSTVRKSNRFQKHWKKSALNKTQKYASVRKTESDGKQNRQLSLRLHANLFTRPHLSQEVS